MSEGKSVEERMKLEVDKAWNSVTSSKFRTEALHKQWKDHLHKLSVGVLLLSMHQYSQPVKDCIIEIKSVNHDMIENPIALRMILGESFVELLNFIIAVLLFRFTSSGGDMTNMLYKLSVALVPVCLGSYFHLNRQGCIPEGLESTLGEDFVKSERQFPVSVGFHFIVTGCLIFMSIGMQQVNKNMEGVERIRNQLSELEMKNANVSSSEKLRRSSRNKQKKV